VTLRNSVPHIRISGSRSRSCGESPAAPEQVRPSTYGEVMRPLDVREFSEEFAELYRSDPLVRRWVLMYDTTSRAEKVSSWTEWTEAQHEAYAAGDTELFSRLRGYSEKEIAEFSAYLKASNEMREKYADDGLIFDLIYELETITKTPARSALDRQLVALSDRALEDAAERLCQP